MASIKQYRGNTWRAIVRRVGHPSQSKTFKLKRDAEKWAADIEARLGVSQFDSLQAKVAAETTVKMIFERYKLEVLPNMRGRNAQNIHTRIMRDADFMRLPVGKITPRDIRDWRDDRVKEIMPASVHRELNSISGVFTHAIKEWGVAIVNPCHSVSRFKGADKPRTQRWSEADTKTLLDAIKWREDMPLKQGRDYLGFVLLIAIETAMRLGEICEAKVGDFYPGEKRLHLELTKNGDSRNVPLSLRAIELLKILAKDKKSEDKLVPINANTFSEYFLEGRKKCGLEHVVFHDSRHTAATKLSTKLANVLELAAVTGHRSLRSLQRYYHPDAIDIANKLG